MAGGGAKIPPLPLGRNKVNHLGIGQILEPWNAEKSEMKKLKLSFSSYFITFFAVSFFFLFLSFSFLVRPYQPRAFMGHFKDINNFFETLSLVFLVCLSLLRILGLLQTSFSSHIFQAYTAVCLIPVFLLLLLAAIPFIHSWLKVLRPSWMRVRVRRRRRRRRSAVRSALQRLGLEAPYVEDQVK